MAKRPKAEEPRGKYYVEPRAGGGRVAMPDIEYDSTTKRITVSATEAARRFSDLVNRASYQGETFVIERGGRPLCQLGPLDKVCTFGELAALLSRLPRPDDEYLDAVEAIIRDQEPVGPSPWER